jgi:hypothetical protein
MERVSHIGIQDHIEHVAQGRLAWVARNGTYWSCLPQYQHKAHLSLDKRLHGVKPAYLIISRAEHALVRQPPMM